MVNLYITLHLRIHFQRTQSKMASNGTLNPTLYLQQLNFFLYISYQLYYYSSMLPGKMSSEGKKQKNRKSGVSQCLTPGGTPWACCLVTDHCLLKLDLEFGLFHKVQMENTLSLHRPLAEPSSRVLRSVLRTYSSKNEHKLILTDHHNELINLVY